MGFGFVQSQGGSHHTPPPKYTKQVALITGGVGGIGAATAPRYLSEGACVMLADINMDALGEVRDGFAKQFGADVVRAVEMNVTDEDAIIAAYADMAVEFGGVVILVFNAGIA